MNFGLTYFHMTVNIILQKTRMSKGNIIVQNQIDAMNEELKFSNSFIPSFLIFSSKNCSIKFTLFILSNIYNQVNSFCFNYFYSLVERGFISLLKRQKTGHWKLYHFQCPMVVAEAGLEPATSGLWADRFDYPIEL